MRRSAAASRQFTTIRPPRSIDGWGRNRATGEIPDLGAGFGDESMFAATGLSTEFFIGKPASADFGSRGEKAVPRLRDTHA